MSVGALEDFLDLIESVYKEHFASVDFRESGETAICPALHIRILFHVHYWHNQRPDQFECISWEVRDHDINEVDCRLR